MTGRRYGHRARRNSVGLLAAALVAAWSLAPLRTTAPTRASLPAVAAHAMVLDGPWRHWITVRVEWMAAPPLQQLAASLIVSDKE